MKIDDSLNGIPAIRSRVTRKPKDDRASAPATTAGDSVEITGRSSQLRKLEEDLEHVDHSDTAKVDAVRQAISEGRFQVDEEAVADALVQETMDQLRRQGGK